MNARISIRDVSYKYRLRSVLDRLTLDMDQFPLALLGANGAGKSTLLRLLAGVSRPKHGVIAFSGAEQDEVVSAKWLRRHVGYLPQHTIPVRGLRCHDQVAYAGWLKGMPTREAGEAASRCLEAVGLADYATRPSHALSGGQLRRVGLAEALMADPRLLVLDEPYASLDPEQRDMVRDTVRALGDILPVIVSTHQTDDLEDIYRSVVVMDQGRVLFFGSGADFLARSGEESPSPYRAESAYRAVLAEERKRVA